MAFRTIKVGTGMTANEYESYEPPKSLEGLSPDDQEKEFALLLIEYVMDRNPLGFELIFGAVETVAKQILVRANLPVLSGQYKLFRGEWVRYQHSDALRLEWMRQSLDIFRPLDIGQSFTKGKALVESFTVVSIAERDFGAHSLEHFAAIIVSLCDQIRLARSAKLHAYVERLACTLGFEICTAVMKLQHEALWDKGRKVQAGARKGAEAKHGTLTDRELKYQRIRLLVEEEVARGFKLTPARRRAAKRLGISYSTVRRAHPSH